MTLMDHADDVLAGGGEMGALMRSIDWAGTPLGAVEGWSASLRMIVRLLLANRFPLLLWWGPDQCQLYNDAYRPVLGTKHPRSMGQPARECWPEIWHIIGPLILTPYTGGPSTWDDDIMLEVNRHGFVEETHFTIAYSPVPDESAPGGIGGVLATVHEITQQVLQERRVAALRDLSARSSEAKTAEEACQIAADALAHYPRDVPFALLYLVDADQHAAHLAAAAGASIGDPIAPEAIELSRTSPDTTTAAWPLESVVRLEQAQVVMGLQRRFGSVPPGPWSDPPNRALVLPVPSNIQRRPAGLLVLGSSVRLGLDTFYRHFCELVATQVAAAVGNARAYEEERRRAELLAELDRAKTTFFNNVSHEFRTPLTLSLGPIEDLLAGARGPISPDQRRELEVAHRNALRLLRLVNMLLDFSRLEAGRIRATYRPTDAAAYTADLASSFRSAIEHAGLRLAVDCPPLPDGVEIYVDRDMWEKIVLNLLSNAFKFTFHGEIRVSVRLAADAQAVQLVVSDTGTGIPADELPRLFERFHRVQGARARTHEGTGIGLALVNELVKLHGGTLAVESAVGHGTTFTITFPSGSAHLPPERVEAAGERALPTGAAAPYVEEALRWAPDPDARSRPVSASEAWPSARELVERTVHGREGGQCHATTSARVLLADDNADMREYIARLLESSFEVEAVSDGIAALAAARQRPPDLILSDVMMPGLGGFALLRALREDARLRDVPVILLSARAGEEATIEGLAAGADDYLIKPFAARELLARVTTHLELARARSAAAHAERVARAEADAARQRLHDLFMQAPALICILRGPDHCFELVNPPYLSILGRERAEEVLGKRVRDVLSEHQARPYLARLDGVYRSGEPYVGREVRLDLATDGTDREVFYDFVYQPSRDARGDVDGILVHAVDVTQQVHARREREEFLATVSHDVKNPLALIRATAQLVRRQVTRGSVDQTRLLSALDSIESASSRISGQIDALLEATRLRMGAALDLDRQPVDLVGLVHNVAAEQQATTERHQLVVATSVRELVGEWDASRIERVVGNLLSNAVKFSPAGGQIGVSVSSAEDEAGAWAEVSVSDHGLGIPANDLPHIWDDFARGANVAGSIPGTGIGLASVRRIVEQHGGSVQVDSREGEGSTFTVRLPLTVRHA
jgi:PAS domain S-box-containing protein